MGMCEFCFEPMNAEPRPIAAPMAIAGEIVVCTFAFGCDANLCQPCRRWLVSRLMERRSKAMGGE